MPVAEPVDRKPRVARLEWTLGLQVFTRTSRTVELTPAGSAILEVAEQLPSAQRALLGVVSLVTSSASCAACPPQEPRLTGTTARGRSE